MDKLDINNYSADVKKYFTDEYEKTGIWFHTEILKNVDTEKLIANSEIAADVLVEVGMSIWSKRLPIKAQDENIIKKFVREYRAKTMPKK